MWKVNQDKIVLNQIVVFYKHKRNNTHIQTFVNDRQNKFLLGI